MKRTALITLILGTVLAVAPAAHAIVWSDGGSSTDTYVLAPSAGSSQVADGWMSSISSSVPSTQTVNPATQALLLRSEGLAANYGMSPATQAVMLRSTGLANYHGSGSVTLRPDILGGDGGASTAPIPTATGDDSFAWGTVGIGAATLVGVMLLGLASLAVTRRRQQPSF